MSAPRVVAVAAGSPAELAGLSIGDELLTIDGRVPKDVIEYRVLVDSADPELTVRRGHEELQLVVEKTAGETMGVEVSSAVFDRVRTCDNHCEFCFIYQLPKGMRKSLYLKDDDYRLSFLYGNFTTLTRFTELDLERVIDERLSPLFVSIHSTDPALRARMLRNPRGAMSLRWLRALLDAGIEVHGQIVVCPGVNDGDALRDSMVGILDEYPELATVACVPLGLSAHSNEASMRPHTRQEAVEVVDLVERWQEIFRSVLGRRLVYAADEYYLLSEKPFPEPARYDGFPQHENGIGMAAAFAAAFNGDGSSAIGVKPGFFAWVDGAPAEGYRSRRVDAGAPSPKAESVVIPIEISRKDPQAKQRRRQTVVVTGEYGASVIEPLLDRWNDIARPTAKQSVRVLSVKNRYFGGNIAVTGLLTGADLSDALERDEPADRYLLPDVCLSEGRFLDGLTLSDLPRTVEVVPSDGLSLRLALEQQ